MFTDPNKTKPLDPKTLNRWKPTKVVTASGSLKHNMLPSHDTVLLTSIDSIVVIVTSNVGAHGLNNQWAVYDSDIDDFQITDWHGLYCTLDKALEAAQQSARQIAQIAKDWDCSDKS